MRDDGERYIHDPDDPFSISTKTVEVSGQSRYVTFPDWRPEAEYWRRECLKARRENIYLKRAIHSRRQALRVLFRG